MIDSPMRRSGFQAVRLVVGRHIHNSYLHALVQTGFIGAVPFIAGLVFAWILLLRGFQNLSNTTGLERATLIQVASVLVFLSIRTLVESTGAFFGVDWLILAPILVYLHVINQGQRASTQQA